MSLFKHLSICLVAPLPLLIATPLSAQTVERHDLIVAANPTLLVSNAEVDGILKAMNTMIAASAYPWDSACTGVKFVRKGDVQSIPKLALTGTYTELTQDLHKKAPSANVMLVSTLDCQGTPGAVGCGSVGQEPLVAGNAPGFEAQLWLHERGHNVGLPHSADGNPDSSYPPNVGMRFMFWQLGIGHVGKTAIECAAFRKTLFASTIAEPQAAGSIASRLAAAGPAANTAPAHLVPTAGAAIAPAARPDAQQAELARLAAAAHLTVPAFRVVGVPWLEKVPVDEVKKLTPADLDSIRTLLQGNPNQYWPQAMSVLALAGTAVDVKVIQRALNLPMAAVAPGTQDPATITQVRNLLAIKLTAPKALGILANRTQSTAAVETLWDTADVNRSHEVVGTDAAESLSKSALTGLSLANTLKARQYLNKALQPSTGINASSTSSPGSGEKTFAPLTESEIKRLKSTSLAVKQHGIEAYIRDPSPIN